MDDTQYHSFQSTTLITQEQSDKRVVVDNISFEIVVPKRVWQAPKPNSGLKNAVQIGIRITNHTQKAIRLPQFDPVLVAVVEISQPGKPWLRSSGGRGRFIRSKTDSPFSCQLLAPEESTTFFPNAALYWQNNHLRLGGFNWGGGWDYMLPEFGTYRIRFRYANRLSITGGCENPEAFDVEKGVPVLLKGIWTGAIETPYVEVQVVQ